MIGIAVTLIACLGTSPKSQGIDGEDAVRIARQFAQKAGIRAKLALTHVSEVDGKPWGFGPGKYKVVGFAYPDKRWAQAYVSLKGEIYLFQVVDPDPSNRLQSVNLHYPNLDAIAMRLLKAGHPTETCALRPWPTGQSGTSVMAYFDITVAGKKFFNLNPTYGYRVDFYPPTAELTYFSRPGQIPAVVATVPKVPEAKAMAVLEHWARTHYRTGRGYPTMFAPGSPWNPTVSPELGYYKFKSEPEARLVWEAHVWTHIKQAPSMESGCLRMFVDAVTGELIEPDDPGMG